MKLRRILTFLWTLIILSEVFTQTMPTALADVLPYSITIDLTNQIVTVFNTSDGTIARQMLCSTGVNNSTPTGTFTLPKKKRKEERKEWYFFRSYNCYAKYATRIHNGIMFHSIPCNRKSESSISKKDVANFGERASHGCIRLRFEDAEFIALNCLEGTVVTIYESDERDEDLRELLKQASYTGENGMSYNSFLGIPDEEGAMGLYSTGNEVKDLQYRLRALGFYDDEISGEYRTTTVNAVKQVQKALDLEQNGYTTAELLETIYSQDAPTAMNVTLTEGMSGPAVRNLQSYLETLLLYSGEHDGIYDGEVIEAVVKFQQTYGYTADGCAAPEIQKAIVYEAERISETFGSASYTCETIIESIPMVVVSSSVRVRLRSGPSKETDALDSLTDGTTLYLLEKGDTWSKVQLGSTVGYIKNVFLEASGQDLPHLVYSDASGSLQVTIGCTLADYQSGSSLPKDTFAEYLTAKEAQEAAEEAANTVQYATVNTGSDDIKLNLRENPSTDGNIVASLDNGTQMHVLLKSSEWSYVTCNGQNGYLMNDYLSYWMGPENALGDEAEPTEDDEEDYSEDDASIDDLYAIVLNKSNVYDLDSEDATLLGTIDKDLKVAIITSDDDWSLIEYNGRQGYMHNIDLQFVLTDD